MLKTIRTFASTTLFLATGSLFSMSATAQQVPKELQPPANEQLLLQVHAKGDQIYTCKGDGAIYVGTESSGSPANRQKRQAVRKAFRRTVLGSERWQPSHGQGCGQRAFTRCRFHSLAAGHRCEPQWKGRARACDLHSAYQHQGWQSTRLRLRCRACRSGRARTLFRRLCVLRPEISSNRFGCDRGMREFYCLPRRCTPVSTENIGKHHFRQV
jgi:hypothetical protein